jgi:hypothetical protein
MLGAHGWIGLGLFLGVAAYSFVGLRRLARRTRAIPHLAWCADLSDALQAGMVVFLTAGAFVDIAFQPELWYFIALSISLREYVRRAEQKAAPATGWRMRGQAGATAADLVRLDRTHGQEAVECHLRKPDRSGREDRQAEEWPHPSGLQA